ncbi:uncharacterized protein A1O5_01887 [Cladophialophora psammophila CBS 110553]|uniref:DUF6594 domain-containing protein n=1 Tax=Cladophialophora psammophila CBS 110553 TaxID=1182543 RepID=W9XDZ4_9EURO|nr:uncharacterized protein A1O5_01887 [Cladophialophora psammophila CBS 110553]EXJ75191.1 hypothetical protein A1O5_01887 [Cladophialophora psammophila CBS 110553]
MNSKVQTPISLVLPDDEPDDTGPVTLGEDYWRKLGEHTKLEQDEIEPALGEFKKLHAMNLTHLLNQLVLIKANIEKNGTTSKKQMTLLRKTLQHYANAIRDFQYITELNTPPRIYRNQKRIALEGSFPELANPFPGSRNIPYNTFYRTLQKRTVQNRDGIRELLRKFLPNRLSWTESERRARPDVYSSGRAPDIYSPFVDSTARFIIGTFGGCALVVPMMVMVFQPSLTKTLITVCVAVVLFALALSLVFETDNKDTISATATYAAVLVVFVGTSTGQS